LPLSANNFHANNLPEPVLIWVACLSALSSGFFYLQNLSKRDISASHCQNFWNTWKSWWILSTQVSSTLGFLSQSSCPTQRQAEIPVLSRDKTVTSAKRFNGLAHLCAVTPRPNSNRLVLSQAPT